MVQLPIEPCLLKKKKKERKEHLPRGLEFQVLWDHSRIHCHELSIDRDCNRYKVNYFCEQLCGLWICKIKMYLHTVLCLVSVRLFATPWSITHQAPLSMGILQARILEWIAMPSSRGSSQPRDGTQVSHIAGGFFNVWATKEAHLPYTSPLGHHRAPSCAI